MLKIIQSEPALTGGAIAALATFLSAWLVVGQPLQGALAGFVTALISLVVRSQVTPVSSSPGTVVPH
ncbi:MAG: hypothetical protein ACRENL_04465 [Candidatus Dormibacteria bacterium]